ncbi:hypothetical protein AMTR_s00011p00105520 [Amborella trichopoda]|uniref:Retrotransposon gag domain-containing protein n=1 Tax=Amborella trichopoda TaxID=13333 RepID=W1NHE9_AMBTC|nr:hypothetical protein AMTR_s00011p00105520 [Amborella trichopoda]
MNFALNDIKLDDTFHVEAIIDKLPPSWKDYRNALMHKFEDFSLEQSMTHLRIEEETKLWDAKEYKSQMVAKAHTIEGPRRKKPRTQKGIMMEEKKEENKDTKDVNPKTT